MAWSMKEPDLEGLARDAKKLLRLEIDELYAVLGCQLLALAPPTRAAGIIVQAFNINRAYHANSWEVQDSKFPVHQWIGGVDEICNSLKRDGTEFIDVMKEEFRKGLCNQNVLTLTDDVDESKMQILIMIISAILKTPPEFESISATLAAMFCKSMHRDICR